MAIGVAQEIRLDRLRRPPGSAVTIAGGMSLDLERLPKSHVAEKPARGGRQRFADARSRVRSQVDERDPAYRREVQGNRGACWPGADHQYFKLAEASP